MKKTLKYSYIYITSATMIFAVTVSVIANLNVKYLSVYHFASLVLAVLMTYLVLRIEVKKWMIYAHAFLFLISIIACQFYVTKLSF